MSGFDEFVFMDATAQADLVRRGEVKPSELLEAAIERAEAVNPKLNAIVRPMYDLARQAVDDGLPDGPFKGVPFLLKDLMGAYAGVPLTAGSASMKDYVPDTDATLTKRLKAAGLAIFGKTNTPEFGMLPTTEPKLFGPAHNPWKLGYTTGGSSGGSSAAVAAGIVPMAHANDGGGSIRIPASCCGLFGLKPTRARNPKGPVFGDVMSGLVEEHAVTRSVRDSAALLDATCGPDVGDPYWAPPRKRSYLEEVGAEPGKLRMAFSAANLAGTEVHADCIEAMNQAAKLCEDLGHHVEEAMPQVSMADQLTQFFTVLWTAGLVNTLQSISFIKGTEPDPAEYEPLTWTLYEVGKTFSAGDYLGSVSILQMITRQIAGFFETYDVMITPTLGQPPVPHGTFDSFDDDPLGGWTRSAAFVPFTPICNCTGQPAMSVPLHWNADGLPIGVQFVSRFGGEDVLYRLAAQLEQAKPWADRKPSL